MFPGIASGILTAFFQDMGYVFSRVYVRKHDDPSGLLIHSQLLMGLVSAVMLPALFIFSMPRSTEFIIPVLFVCAGSGAGQYFFFRAERSMESSRVSSMMGLRVVLLALISSAFLGIHYSPVRWSGIILAALSAVMINYEGGKFRTGGLGDLALSLVFYCLSDLSVGHMVRGFGISSVLTASLFAICTVNILTAAVLAPACRGRAGWRMESFAAALPFASSWYLKQFFLYVCYALIGPVHGNVVLSIRGPLAVGISFVLTHIRKVPAAERRTPVSVWLQRAAATVLMMLAIALYSLGA